MKRSSIGLNKTNTSECAAPMADTIVSGLTHQSLLSCMPECRLQNKNPVSTHKEPFYNQNTPMSHSNTTLDLDSISKDIILEPFWNQSCEEMQQKLWLPQVIGGQEQQCHSSTKYCNYTQVKLNALNQQLTPKHHNLMLNISLPSSHLSAIHKAESEATNAKIIATKKIRIYPNDIKRFWDITNTCRRAYNLCIEKFTTTPISEKIDPNDMRREIRAQVKEEAQTTNRFFVSSSVDEAIRDAGKTKSAIISKRTKGLSCGFNYKSIKKSTQSFYIQKFSGNALSKIAHITEQVPDESYGKMARVVCEHGQWFVCVQSLIDIKNYDFENQEIKICSVDPGVRCFATCYSLDKLNQLGDDFAKDKLLPIALKIRRLIGLRQKLKNTKQNQAVWYKQRMVNLNRSLDKLKAKRSGIINELHKYCAWFLVTNYDIILLPKFETKNMVKRGGRKIGRNVVSRMLDLSHYKFQNMLRWMAKKYSKMVVAVNESYTSKTRSWDGVVVDNLGGAKQISDENIVVNRDHNGARGIMLRALTRQLQP